MSLITRNPLAISHYCKINLSSGTYSQSQLVQCQRIDKISSENPRNRIRKRSNVQLQKSRSVYDVETVELKEKTPLAFPESLERIMENQQDDGSWCPNSLPVDGSLPSTNSKLVHHKRKLGQSLVKRDIYSQLCAIDNLYRLGIDRYCRSEIENVLDNIYRYWLQKDDKIFSNINCSALGFRLLRMNAYDVSFDELAQFSEEEHFFNSASRQFKNTNTILELFKASKMIIYQQESILEKLEAWTGSFLKQQLLTCAIKDHELQEEVHHALRYRYDRLDFLESRWTIEHQKKDIGSYNEGYHDILALAIEDYNLCQSLYQEEYKHLERWVKDCRFDELKFARVLLLYCYYPNTAVLVAPELADARLSITKNCILATVIDDFFDVAGSKEELENLTQLVERWGETSDVDYCSGQVEIIFSAFRDMIKELDTIAFKHHGRSIGHHLVKIWHDLLKSMMKEAEWTRDNATPSLDEYMENAYISFALGPICHITTYFLGITLPNEVMAGPEIYNLFKHVSLVGRLLNDLKSFKREREQGKYNSVSLRILHSQGTMTEEEAINETKRDIERYRKELLRIVVQKEKSSVPKPFRDFFWKSCNVMHYFYMDNDGYSSPKNEMANDAKAVLWEPITS